MTLEQFIEDNRGDMLCDLRRIAGQLKHEMEYAPEDYTESGCEGPSIDIRLCIDRTRDNGFTWIFRTGLVDYDQRHSDYCAASCVTLDTKEHELISELIGDLNV